MYFVCNRMVTAVIRKYSHYVCAIIYAHNAYPFKYEGEVNSKGKTHLTGFNRSNSEKNILQEHITFLRSPTARRCICCIVQLASVFMQRSFSIAPNAR